MIREEVREYERLQDETAAATEADAKRVLELGTGTGETARRVLARNPAAVLIGLDASEEMLARARGAAGRQRRAARLAAHRSSAERTVRRRLLGAHGPPPRRCRQAGSLPARRGDPLAGRAVRARRRGRAGGSLGRRHADRSRLRQAEPRARPARLAGRRRAAAPRRLGTPRPRGPGGRGTRLMGRDAGPTGYSPS